MNALPIPARQITGAQFVLATAARLTWQVGRLPLLAVLTLLEPVIRAVCSLAMVLGVISAMVFEFSAVSPRFPFLEMLALSLGFGLALLAYYGLLFLVSR
jgi:hypothetical protein